MDRRRIGWVVSVIAATAWLCGCTEEPKQPQDAPGSLPATQPADRTGAGASSLTATIDAAAQTHVAAALCPVSGESIDPEGKKILYKGKSYGFCCDDCMETFKAEPDKYASTS